ATSSARRCRSDQIPPLGAAARPCGFDLSRCTSPNSWPMTTCDLRGARLAPLLLVPAFATGACSAPHGSGATRASVAALFAAPNAWTRDVSAAPASPSSAATIALLASLGGWGTGELRIDFSMNVLHADASTPRVAFDPTSDFYV